MHPSRRLVPLVLGTALIVLTTACGHAAGQPAAANVAGTEVTDAQLAVTAGVFESIFGLQHAACGQQDGVGDTAEAACNRYSLGAMIQFRLVQDYASKNGITVSENQVQNAIDGFEAQVGKDTLAALLTTNNVTHDDFTQLVRLSLLENEVATHLGSVMKQTEANAFSDWVRQQDQAGAIDVDPSFGRFDPSTLQVVRITSTDPSATTSPATGSVVSPSP